MKHIKIRAEYKDNAVSVTILQQTHCSDEFGIRYDKELGYHGCGGRMFKFGDAGLYAPWGHQPQVYNNEHFFKGKLFLLGQEEVKNGTEYAPFKCTLEEYKLLKMLVIEYNKWGETQ